MTLAKEKLAEYAKTITGQIIGGLALELERRFPYNSIELGSFHDDPAVRFSSVWVVIDQDRFKVVIPNSSMNPNTTLNSMQTRRVLYECSLGHPEDDFKGLYTFLQSYDDKMVNDG